MAWHPDTQSTSVADHLIRLATLSDFNPVKLTGKIILNVATIDQTCADQALKAISPVLTSPFCFSSGFVLARDGSNLGHFQAPPGKALIGTTCCMTIAGLLNNAGISVMPKYFGTVEVEHNLPKRFSSFLSYRETSLLLIESFISSTMTSVFKTITTGCGEVFGSFMEIPESALEDARRICAQLKVRGLGGALWHGPPSQPFLDMPVDLGNAGMVLLGDLNPVAALIEQGIRVEYCSTKILFDYDSLSTGSAH